MSAPTSTCPSHRSARRGSARCGSRLIGIDYGETASYGQIAARLGKTNAASRAVGVANGANPIPIVIPCHRVIGANGTLTGYAGGLDRKQALLEPGAGRPLLRSSGGFRTVEWGLAPPQPP
ncbi:MGMT family protein [Nocardioides convexus]|uniref:methylated-DNA--[protein]-cysteine S-methyltransferase n=1 Tax=Nocardioides convexus TaxID=2712224 RepID=UPI0024181B90|nr:MGMT family protein [Nocardioides convexus]